MQPPADIDRTIRQVVVGYRVVAALWLITLGIIALAGGDSPPRPGVVTSTMILAGGWAILTVALHIRAPQTLRSWAWVAIDLVVAIWTLLSPEVAGSQDFYGGYPMSPVFLAAYSRGMVGGMVTAIVMAGVQLTRLVSDGAGGLTAASAAVLIYLFAGAVASWAMNVLREADRTRRRAEEALASERAERARIEERADMAAHLHDSVLQTLALIQRNSERAEQVWSLARSQERELRAWLYGSAARGESRHLMAELRSMCAEVEDLHHVRVEIVTVGDAPCDERTEVVLQAARESIVNAAKHSGAARVSVYAEVTEDEITIFVRDRGVGFDPKVVSPDRRGLRDSVVARMERNDGLAAVRSAPGEGTEVELRLAK